MERWRPLKPVRIICIAQSPKTFYNFTLWWRHNFWNSFSRLSESFFPYKTSIDHKVIESLSTFVCSSLCPVNSFTNVFRCKTVGGHQTRRKKNCSVSSVSWIKPLTEVPFLLKCLSLLWTSNVKIIVWLTALVEAVLVLDYSTSKS